MQNNQLLVNEIFFSLQGEGIHTGVPTVFIRFQSCSLKCKYCDTKYAQSSDPKMGRLMTVEEILKKFDDKYRTCRYVCITGGEPFEQDPILLMELFKYLAEAGKQIIIETSGYKPIDLFVTFVNGVAPDQFHFCVDYKLPSSGMQSKMVHEHFNETFLPLRQCDSIKYVIGSDEDWGYTVNHLAEMRRFGIQAEALFSPVWRKGMDLQGFAEKVKEVGCRFRPGRLSLQIHKIIWPAEKRGV